MYRGFKKFWGEAETHPSLSPNCANVTYIGTVFKNFI